MNFVERKFSIKISPCKLIGEVNMRNLMLSSKNLVAHTMYLVHMPINKMAQLSANIAISERLA
jgi:hypothetical protein